MIAYKSKVLSLHGTPQKLPQTKDVGKQLALSIFYFAGHEKVINDTHDPYTFSLKLQCITIIKSLEITSRSSTTVRTYSTYFTHSLLFSRREML